MSTYYFAFIQSEHLTYSFGASTHRPCFNFTRTCFHLATRVHSYLTEDLVVDLVRICLRIRITCSFHCIVHHLALHLHFCSLLGEFLHDLLHLLRIHVSIDPSHNLVDSFQTVKHCCIHLSSSQLLLYRP